MTYELKLNTPVTLKWGTWAMKLYSQIKGKPDDIQVFFEDIATLTEGANSSIVFQIVVGMLRAGYEAYNKKPLSEEQACDIIDELGGITNINNEQIMGFVNYVIDRSTANITPLPSETDGEKKS